MSSDSQFQALRRQTNFLVSFRAFLVSRGMVSIPASKTIEDIPVAQLPTTATRQQLIDWETEYCNRDAVQATRYNHRNKSLPLNCTGPLGVTNCWPAWLTNDQNLRAGRGMFYLPWERMETFFKMKEERDAAAAKAAEASKLRKMEKEVKRALKEKEADTKAPSKRGRPKGSKNTKDAASAASASAEELAITSEDTE